MPKLTDKLLNGLKLEPGRKDRMLFDTECRGLGVRLTLRKGRGAEAKPELVRTFIVQWTDRATLRKLREPLGVWGALTIEQAREGARARLGAVAKGIDVKAELARRRQEAERERAERALTFGALIEEWAALHLAHRRPRYATEAQRALRYVFAHILNRPAARVTRADAINTLDVLIKAGKAAMARCTLAYGRACFRWAQQRGKVPINPFQGLPTPLGQLERDRVLTDEELGRVWGAACSMPYPWGPLYRLVVLTLARREEVAAMKWSELAPDLSIWSIPGARMKRGQAHVVDLPDMARDLLATIPRSDKQDLVFTTNGRTPVSGFSHGKVALDRASGVAGWRLHDIRRTGVSALAAMGIDSIVADKLLAHQPGKLRGAARVYQRHDFAAERAAALRAWATHVLRCAEGRVAAKNVVRLRAAN